MKPNLFFIQPSFSQGLIPLCVHNDGAEFYSNSEYEVYSIGSLFSQGSVWDCKFPCFTVAHAQMHEVPIKQKVNETVAKIFSWSLKSCASGLWPEKGPNGEDLFGFRKERAGTCLAGGWRGCFFGFRSDAKVRKNANEFPRSYQHSFICEACLAQKQHKNWEPLLNYKNFYSSAGYRMTTIGSLAFDMW